jgi:putative membrane-bound dehydrogenase-like protein
MVPRFLIASLLLLSGLAIAQESIKVGERMDPVVPENLIPPSPVLSGDDALKSFQLAPGFVIEPVVTEPLVESPICLDFDSRGRMWVCEMRDYMPDIDAVGEETPAGRIVILEDTDHDGKVDKRTVFLDKIWLPRAVNVSEDGVLFIEKQRLCWVKRKGDEPIGEPQVIDDQFASQGNVEHKPNGLLSNLDNRYYLAKSGNRLHRVGDEWKIETTSFRGQWGIARDDYGRLYHNNNSTLLFGDVIAPNLLQGNPGVKMKQIDFVQLGSNQVWPARVTPGVNRAYIARSNGYKANTLDPKTFKLISATAAAGMAIYRGTNFPKEWYGTGFSTESAANLVKAIRITEKDGTLKGSHPLGEKEFLSSTDERFRPVNLYNAPDGSLYLVDMYHGVIQHKTYMTPYLRDQILSRGLDKPASGLGRIYRIRATSGKLETAQNIESFRGEDLVKLLGHPNAWQREAAQRLLVARKDDLTKDLATIPALIQLATAAPTVARIHAIWTLEGMGILKAEHLESAIRSSNAKLQSSALWASTRLLPEELAKLEPALLDATLSSPEVAPYLARALGPLGTPKAFSRLAALMRSSKRPFVRAATISGLDQNEVKFRDTVMKNSKEKKFLEWLNQGIDDSDEVETANSSLSGEQLASFERGKKMFLGEAACFGCHSADGTGVANLGPPLDNSEWVTGKPEILINILLHGMSGPITVDGVKYKPIAEMPGLGMNPLMDDLTIADLSTYIRNEWGNKASAISAEQVRNQREATKTRGARVWTAEELTK